MDMKQNKNTVKKQTVKNSLFHTYYDLVVEYSQVKYVKELLIGLAILGLVSTSYFMLNWYKKRQNIQAFAGLVEISKSYEKALAQARKQHELPVAEQVENPFEDTQLLLDAIALAHSNSTLSPFFIFYQAELALQQECDYDKACKLMEKGLYQLPKKSIYYDMFSIKLIKMLLDSPEENVVLAALEDLKLIAQNSENYCYQDALHLLASYEVSRGNMPAAIEAWKKLAMSSLDKSLMNSPFVAQAQEKLKSLNISLETSN